MLIYLKADGFQSASPVSTNQKEIAQCHAHGRPFHTVQSPHDMRHVGRQAAGNQDESHNV